jgi:hypothetical protein
VRIVSKFIIGLTIIGVAVGNTTVAYASPAHPIGQTRAEIATLIAGHPGAKLIADDTVQVSNNHFVTFSKVQSRSPEVAQASCPNDAYCWFEHAYYGGNIEWSTGHVGPCGYNLAVFLILGGRASSWWNNSDIAIGVIGGFWESALYSLRPHSSSVYVGDGYNDENDYYCG